MADKNTSTKAPKATAKAKGASEQALRNQAYAAATTRLRDLHKEEFISLAKEEAAARGVEYNPRPTPEERALALVREQMKRFPELADQIKAEADLDTFRG